MDARSVKRGFARTALLAWIALAPVFTLAAEPDLLTAHAQAIAKNAEGMSFTIERADRRTRFHVGEPIPLDLVYAFREPGAYQINDGLAHGSGTARMLEVFRVWPEAKTERRKSNQSQPSHHFSAGGTPLDVDASRSYRYRVYLNEWRRLDEPGKYQFYSISARVWTANVWPQANNELRATSNLLEVEIVPAAPPWQDDQLRRAIATLDRPVNDAVKDRALRREALRQLRFLDTEAATRELARRETGGDDEESYEIGMGLHESRFKPSAVEVLVEKLNAPSFAVTAQFLFELPHLAADAQLPGDDQNPQEARVRFEKKRALQQTLLVKYSDAVWAAAEHKEPLARARSLLEQIEFVSSRMVHDLRPLSAERLAIVRAAVLPVFDQLPAMDQYRVLESYWNRLGGIEFLPVLRKFIAAPPVPTKEMYWPRPIDSALRRVFELAPDDGRALILAEIRRDPPRASHESLTLLPDEPIPELDDLLASRLEQAVREDGEPADAEWAARLLARYGSPAVYDRVRQIYGDGDDEGRWPCALRAALLAYLMQHNPQQGAELLNKAIDSRAPLGCVRGLLVEMASIHMSTDLERFAIEHLDDANPEIAGNAARLLGNYGSAAAEPALWKRLERWHDTWKGRVAELKIDDEANPTDPQVRLEEWLVYALVHAPNWMTDRSKLGRLQILCLTKRSQDDVARALERWAKPLAIQFTPGANSEFISAPSRPGSSMSGFSIDDTWFVGQYYVHSLANFKTLLARLPPGTTLSFPMGILTDAAAEARLFGELEQDLASRGMKLLKRPGSK